MLEVQHQETGVGLGFEVRFRSLAVRMILVLIFTDV